MADKLDFIREEMKRLEETKLLVRVRTIGSAVGAYMIVDGKKVLNFCTNDYLGLANHPRLREAAKKGIDEWGAGPAAVRSIAGTLELHLELERAIAEFKGVEASLYVQSGFCANQAVIPALVGKEDCIFSDRLNHASIIDGCRLSRAKILVFEHRNAEDADRVIRENLHKYGKGLLVTDGVFSMDGDVAPLDELYEVAAKHGVMTMVDDAHGEGVLGGGRGIVHHFGLAGQFDVEMGTFSKAFGVVGGCLAGSKEMIDFIRQKARPFLFSSAVTAGDTAACLESIRILSESEELVNKLWANGEYFKKAMQELGFDTGVTETPIVPVMLGEAPLAKQFSRRLFEEGVFAMALGFPTVPRGEARIRVMNSASHDQEHLDLALSAFEKIGRELGVI